MWEQPQWAWLLGWAVTLVVAAVAYDGLAPTSLGLIYTLMATIFGVEALFTALAWPYAFLLALALVFRRTMALGLFA